MTINKAMNIALSGLNAHQAALNVVSHNIANINTEGYRRQQVHFAEMRTPLYDNSVSGQIASLAGVRIDGIKTASILYMKACKLVQILLLVLQVCLMNCKIQH